jgi:LysM repeat protein
LRTSRADVARYAAPAAFLVLVTILVWLIHAGLSGGKASTPNAPAVPVSTAAATTSSSTTTPAASAPTTPMKQYYTIRSGDSFGVVAGKFNTTVEALQALNPDVSSNSLTIGQKIRVK